MQSKCGIHFKAIALLLTAAALLALIGCGRPSGAQVSPGASRAGEATASAPASGAAQTAGEASGTSDSSGAQGGPGAGPSSSSKLSTKDASALDAELSAIQSELDRLSLPSDGDFDSIGSGLQ